jgi:Cytochrome c554 and c-prime
MNRWTRVLAVLAPAAVILALAPAPQAEQHPYYGTKKCKNCHLKEYKSWAETKMAHAFDTLKPGEAADIKKAAGLDPAKDYTKDATCLRCHTTGHGAEGGFVDFETTPDMAGVGCESCHGAGGTYTKPEYMSLKNKEYKKADVVAAGLVGEVGKAQCITCHNKDNPTAKADYVFDYEANKAKGLHETFPLKYHHE